MTNGPLRQFRWVGYAEGTSFLVLLGIAMPIKYLAGVPEVVLVVGWAHGVLWMLYMLAALRVGIACKWPPKLYFAAAVASVVPFGPFVFDRWLGWRQYFSGPARWPSQPESPARGAAGD